jgi:hypothetical protein
MAKFVWLELINGTRIPVNPDQVARVQVSQQKHTMIVFGAVAGGLDQLGVKGSVEEVVAILSGEATWPPPADDAADALRHGLSAAGLGTSQVEIPAAT